MKTCNNLQDGDLPERNDKEASCRKNISKKKLYKRLRILNYKKKATRPSAPHNTTQYIMDQHPLIAYDYEDLWGSVLGHALQYKLS